MAILNSVLPLARAGHQSFYSNGKIFVVGGQDSANNMLNDIQCATVNADTTIGLWSVVAGNLGIHTQGSLVLYNNLIIVAGGISSLGPNVYSNDVVVYTFDTQLGLKLVQKLLMPVPCARQGMVVVGNYLYVMGGDTATGVQTSQVWKVQIDNSGIVGQWTQDLSLPQVMSGFACMAVGNTIYTLGGVTGTTDLTPYVGTVSSQGSITAWAPFLATGLTRTDFASTMINVGFVAALGHNGAGTGFTDAQLVTLSPTGGFYGNKKVANFPVALSNAGLASDGTNLYVTGGFLSGVAQTSVYSDYVDPGYQDPTEVAE